MTAFIQIGNNIFDENEVDCLEYTELNDDGGGSSLEIGLKSGHTVTLRSNAADDYWELWQEDVKRAIAKEKLMSGE